MGRAVLFVCELLVHVWPQPNGGAEAIALPDRKHSAHTDHGQSL
jgi:hypothetical protein